MTAASFWSLLAPAIEISEANMGNFAFIPVAIGFALGAVFVHLSDNLIPRFELFLFFMFIAIIQLYSFVTK